MTSRYEGIARSRGELIVGVIVLIMLACVMMVAIDERLSRQLDDVDITWAELNPKPPTGQPIARATR